MAVYICQLSSSIVVFYVEDRWQIFIFGHMLPWLVPEDTGWISGLNGLIALLHFNSFVGYEIATDLCMSFFRNISLYLHLN